MQHMGHCARSLLSRSCMNGQWRHCMHYSLLVRCCLRTFEHHKWKFWVAEAFILFTCFRKAQGRFLFSLNLKICCTFGSSSLVIFKMRLKFTSLSWSSPILWFLCSVQVAAINPNHPLAQMPLPPSMKNCIQLAACEANELLPMIPDLPADLFTSCLTTPIKIALRW